MRLRKFLRPLFAACALACVLGFNSRSAVALINVEPGTYEVPAFLTPGETGPVAIFNWNTRSLCRIHLTGKVADSLHLLKPKGALIKIVVSRRIDDIDGTAQLVRIRPLGRRRLLRSVLNNLKADPMESGHE